MGVPFGTRRKSAGGYRMLRPKPYRGAKATWEARCAEPCCMETVEFEAGHVTQVPDALRELRWSVTGRTRGAVWWCPAHRLEHGR